LQRVDQCLCRHSLPVSVRAGASLQPCRKRPGWPEYLVARPRSSSLSSAMSIWYHHHFVVGGFVVCLLWHHFPQRVPRGRFASPVVDHKVAMIHADGCCTPSYVQAVALWRYIRRAHLRAGVSSRPVEHRFVHLSFAISDPVGGSAAPAQMRPHSLRGVSSSRCRRDVDPARALHFCRRCCYRS
jgi:hypothetical protein